MAKIAYLVLTHGLPYQTIDFLWSVWRKEDAYFVHVDRQSPAIASAAFGAIAAAYPNIHLVPSDICTWGGFSLIEASRRCLASALAADSSWSHAVLASGTHLPLQPAADLEAKLEPGCSYLNFHRLDLEWAKQNPPDWYSSVADRLLYEYQEVPGLGHMRGPAKAAPLNVELFWGFQWWILSRAAAEFACSRRHGSLEEYFSSSLIPDESFFQTILLNSPLREQLRQRQIVWQQWGEKGHPQLLSDGDITSALASNRFFARKAGAATMRDGAGFVAQKIASLDRASWVKSVTAAFANFLSPSMLAVIGGGYGQRGNDGLDVGLAESEFVAGALMTEVCQTIRSRAAERGLTVRLSPSVYAVNRAQLSCEFPDARTRANFLLILRFCNLEIAWIGIYLPSTDLEKAAADLRDFPDRGLIDFSFPPVPGLDLHHDLLEFSLRRKGVIALDRSAAGENIESIIREYLELLSKIPGMVPNDSSTALTSAAAQKFSKRNASRANRKTS